MERVYQPDITWPLAYLTRNNSDDIICSAGALSMRRFITATSCISSENLRELVIVAGRAIQGNNGGRYFIQEEVHDEDIAILIVSHSNEIQYFKLLLWKTVLNAVLKKILENIKSWQNFQKVIHFDQIRITILISFDSNQLKIIRLDMIQSDWITFRNFRHGG